MGVNIGEHTKKACTEYKINGDKFRKTQRKSVHEDILNQTHSIPQQTEEPCKGKISICQYGQHLKPAFQSLQQSCKRGEDQNITNQIELHSSIKRRTV